MAIAVMPEDPRDRGERFLLWVVVAAAIIIALFVVAMLDAYVF